MVYPLRPCADIDTMNYFRALWARGEHSERGVAIAAEAINGNPANYTAWYVDTRGQDISHL